MKPISSITKVDQVRHAILELILSGGLAPGQRLVEARLAADLGVSQATVNAALQVLHDQAIVCKILNRSSNVSRYADREIENLFTVRSILEPAAAAAASRNFDRDGRASLEKEVDAMRRAAEDSNLSRFCLADYNFHQEVYRQTQNPVLIQACQAIAAAPFAYILCDCPLALPTDYRSLAEDHQEIIHALEQGPEAAAEITRDRIKAWKMHSVRALESIAEGRTPVRKTPLYRLNSKLLAATVWVACPISAQQPAIDFSRDVAPLFARACTGCHGADQQLSGFSLSTRESALRGGLHGAAIVPGKSADSALVKRLLATVEPAMPLGGRLADAEIALIRRWIDAGAVWGLSPVAAPVAPAAPAPMKISAADRNWWAFRKPARSAPPAAASSTWNRNPIDGFVFAKLKEKNLQPAPRAAKSTLVRRAFLDLTGLPPDPAEVEAFLKDGAPDAFAKLVDRLLASPRYGERWGRHWLDVARYADSGGYEQDFSYTNAWRYRDYVIRAFNQDKPYDRFIREQIAGDELDDADYDALIATGFHRVGATVGFREKDNPQYRFTYLDDLIGTTSRAFLGLTVSCARCHDHKFDPISQMDYYKLMAVFNPYINYDHPLVPKAQVEAYEAKKAEIEALAAPLKEKIRALEAPSRAQAFEQKLATFPAEIQAAVRTPEYQRTEGQKLLATQVLSIRGGNYRNFMTAADRASVDALTRQLRAIEKNMPAPLPVAMGVRDGDYRLAPKGPGDDEAPGKAGSGAHQEVNETYVPVPGKPYHPPRLYFADQGDGPASGPEVAPGFLEILSQPGVPVAIKPADGRITTGRRRALAEWIAQPDNPLTARVMVNRIWQHHFGRGIAATPSNFGRMGRRPSHPELLDWLATEFVDARWSVKQMHRLIMNSETYQMASAYAANTGLEKDPDNIFLWHYPQRRLEGEAIRDSILAVTGNLNLQAGGPAYFPPVPAQVRKAVYKGIWVVNDEGPDVWRRGVYSYYKRGMKFPLFEVFDQPDPNVTCELRSVSTVPTQALTLLNNEFVLAQARFFAERVRKAAGPEQESQVRAVYRFALSREPSAREMRENVEFLNRQMTAAGGSELKALTDLCDVVLNLNEFVYIN